MPIHLYYKKALKVIVGTIGNLMRIDYNTKESAREKFGRIVVAVDLTKPFASQFCIDDFVQKIKYEGL